MQKAHYFGDFELENAQEEIFTDGLCPERATNERYTGLDGCPAGQI